MKRVTIDGCGTCPFANTDSEQCNADDREYSPSVKEIAVWDIENDNHPPEECPLWGGGVLVTIKVLRPGTWTTARPTTRRGTWA